MFSSPEAAIEMSARLADQNEQAALNLLKMAHRRYPQHDALGAELAAVLLRAGQLSDVVALCSSDAVLSQLLIRLVGQQDPRLQEQFAALLDMLPPPARSNRLACNAAAAAREAKHFGLRTKLARFATVADPSCSEAWLARCDAAAIEDPVVVLETCRAWTLQNSSAADQAFASFWDGTGGFIAADSDRRLALLEQAMQLWPGEAKLKHCRLATLVELGRLQEKADKLSVPGTATGLLEDLQNALVLADFPRAQALLEAQCGSNGHEAFLCEFLQARIALVRARAMHPDDIMRAGEFQYALNCIPDAALLYIAFEELALKRFSAALYCWYELAGRKDWHSSAIGLWNAASVLNKIRSYGRQTDVLVDLLVKFDRSPERLRGRPLLEDLRERPSPSAEAQDYFVRLRMPDEIYRPDLSFTSIEFTPEGAKPVEILPFERSGYTIVRRPGLAEKRLPRTDEAALSPFPFLARRRDVTLVGPDMIPCEEGNYPLLGFNYWSDDLACELLVALCERDVWHKRFERTVVESPAIHLFSDKCVNYWHWNFDMFARLGLIENFPELRGIPILVPRNAPRYAMEMLSLVVGRGRLLTIPPGHVLCKDLFLIGPTGCQHSYLFSFDWVAKAMAPHRATQPGHERLFLSRRSDRRRSLQNLDEVAEVLAAHGFQEFEPGNHSVVEQVRAFSSADVIVSTYGSAATNIVHARPGTIVIELIPAPGVPMIWQYLGGYRRQRMGIIYGEAAGREDYPYLLSDQKFTIAPDLLGKILSQLDTAWDRLS